MKDRDKQRNHINETKRRQNMENKRKKQKEKRGIGSVIRIIVLIIALCVFIYSGYQLYTIFSEYSKGEKEYTTIKELGIKETKDEATGEKNFAVDFEVLKAMNPEIVGWIRFDQPEEISYPVVKGQDNSKYLTQTFEENDNKLGTLFVDMNNQGDFSDKNTFIYGHNMKNKTMFAQLLEYKNKEFYDANQFFYIYTPNGKVSKYQVCAAAVIKDNSPLYNMFFQDAEAWQTYINLMKQTSAYDTGAVVTAESQIVSLSTCTNVADDERFLVQGVKIGEE